MENRIAKIIVGVFIFLGIIICCENVSKASNLELFEGQFAKTEIFEVTAVTSNDITEEIRKVGRSTIDGGKLLIHIPSGEYIINNIAICSNIQ